MKAYLTDGMTVLAFTETAKPKDENSPEFEQWVNKLLDCERFPIMLSLERILEKQGFKDWDEVKEFKDFRIVAIHPTDYEGD